MASVKMVEICGAQNKKRQRKLTMEQYLDYLHAEKRPDLTVDQLEQIVDMHGFRKFRNSHRALNGNGLKVPKEELVEIVSKLELMDPTRSTVDGDGVTSDAELSFEDVVKDLDALNWHECCVTSVKTLKAAVESHDGVIPADGSEGASLSAAAAVVSEKQQSAAKRGNRSAGKGGSKDAVLGDGSEGTTLSAAAAVVSEKQQPAVERQNRSVGKRSSKDVNLSDGSEGTVLSSVTASLKKNQPAEKRLKVTVPMKKAGNVSTDSHNEAAANLSGGSEGTTVLSGDSASLEKQQPAEKSRKVMEKAGNASSEGHNGGSKGTVPTAASSDKQQPASKRRKGLNLIAGKGSSGGKEKGVISTRGSEESTLSAGATSSEKQQPEDNCESGKVGDENSEKLEWKNFGTRKMKSLKNLN